ncbi:Metalloendopeptidase OMA1-like 1 [Homarus americanus]|uniref:Metalloendopeptidase OMA1, mitochondrial n=1 Tax=Homarus americanus TaxID=6706 RepID=A0A8J5K0L9_HOMAM|nr:Metalloendopeptidase OMA1-like 1 [Homarus americanus]
MFRGMMDLLENEDQVAFVLAHEMSHAILEHSAEQLSHGYLLDVLILMPLAVIWAFIPSDGLAVVTHWFLNQVVQVLLQLPYSRSLENEADCVGLRLAAKMSVMDKLREARGEVGEEPAWLSTHPSHSDRQEMLDYQMSEALMLREACQCPRLTKSDPRHSIWMLQKNLIHTSSKQSPQESSGPDHKIRTREPAKIQ